MYVLPLIHEKVISNHATTTIITENIKIAVIRIFANHIIRYGNAFIWFIHDSPFWDVSSIQSHIKGTIVFNCTQQHFCVGSHTHLQASTFSHFQHFGVSQSSHSITKLFQLTPEKSGTCKVTTVAHGFGRIFTCTWLGFTNIISLILFAHVVILPLSTDIFHISYPLILVTHVYVTVAINGLVVVVELVDVLVELPLVASLFCVIGNVVLSIDVHQAFDFSQQKLAQDHWVTFWYHVWQVSHDNHTKSPLIAWHILFIVQTWKKALIVEFHNLQSVVTVHHTLFKAVWKCQTLSAELSQAELSNFFNNDNLFVTSLVG